MKDIICLAIESSCDETSIAILEFENENNNFKVLANTVSSQIDIHKAFGGVVPEIASRQHVKNIGWVLDEALSTANVKLEDIQNYIKKNYLNLVFVELIIVHVILMCTKKRF